MKQLKPWFQPTDSLRKLPKDKWHALMSREEHGFISRIVKDLQPKKILEVGVAYGGTTALLIKSLEMAGIEGEIFSVDLNSKFRGKKIGCMLKNINIPTNIKHSLTTGKLLKDCIEEIGEGIDLVVLDTSHNIPGEILEFLTVLPYMSKDGIVVLHDVHLSNLKAAIKKQAGRSLRKICPKVLFSTVSGEKFYNLEDEKGLYLSNIAAFKINDSTFSKIEDLFFSISHTWYDDWSKEVLDSYREYLSKYYSPQCLILWDLIISNQQEYKENIAIIRKYLSRLDKYYCRVESLRHRQGIVIRKIKSKIRNFVKSPYHNCHF
ncbi:MAG: class I SAM-dependent methyltransferase [Muribaculaceae bacterium]|nr:class I SAM-dependent methyltransferase [Muribaculaceae bacterium]